MPLPGFGTGTKMWGKGRGGKVGYWDSNPPLLIIESPMAIYKYIHQSQEVAFNTINQTTFPLISLKDIVSFNRLTLDTENNGSVRHIMEVFIGQAQKCGGRGGGVKLVTGIPTLPS
jgi:hypothetical protein